MEDTLQTNDTVEEIVQGENSEIDENNIPIIPEFPPTEIIPAPVNSNALDNNINNIAQKVIEEQDVDESKKLVELFNWNISKKNVLRILKLNGLFDKISDQMIERFEKRPGEFSNSDLLSYLQTVQTAMEKSTKGLGEVKENAPIQVQQNTQVNINVLDTFDRAAKERIEQAIKTILSSAKEPTPVEGEFTEVQVGTDEKSNEEQRKEDNTTDEANTETTPGNP